MLELPRIGQGTWNVPESGADRARAVAAIRTGIDLGMTHIDTAEMYGAGAAEELVAEAVAPYPREQLFITSKVLPSNASYKGTLRACEQSLRRLKLEYLDLYLLHWPSSYPLEETMRALEKLASDGKARHIGVSNFDVDEVKAAQKHLSAVPLACNQVLYHLQERGIEADLIPYCAAYGIAVVGYTPFGRGRFPARAIGPDGVLTRVAQKHAKTTRQVILNFLTRLPHVYAIPKASNEDHVRENAGAMGWDLDAADVEAIDAAFPVRRGPLATL